VSCAILSIVSQLSAKATAWHGKPAYRNTPSAGPRSVSSASAYDLAKAALGVISASEALRSLRAEVFWRL